MPAIQEYPDTPSGQEHPDTPSVQEFPDEAVVDPVAEAGKRALRESAAQRLQTSTISTPYDRPMPTLAGLGGTIKEIAPQIASDLFAPKIVPEPSPEELEHVSPGWQEAVRISKPVGELSEQILTGSEIVGPGLEGLAASSKFLKPVARLAIPLAGAAAIRHIGEQTGTVAGTPASQRKPGEMAGAITSDAGQALLDVAAILSTL